VFFIDAPLTIPQDYFLLYIFMHAAKPDKKEAFAQLLAEADGGTNCIMTSASSESSDISQILANRKAAIDAELAECARQRPGSTRIPQESPTHVSAR
jgi:hypothetical protein